MDQGFGKNSPLLNTISDFMILLKFVMAIVFVIYFFSGITSVEPQNVALIMRMGKLAGDNPADQVHMPGWLFALPKPFDEVIKVPVKEIRQVKVTELALINSGKYNTASDTISPTEAGYCISGDENICQTSVLVKYRIQDPVKAMTGSSDPFNFFDVIINDLTVSEMTKAAGRFSIDGLLTSDKLEFAEMVKEEIQKNLNELESGLEIIEVEIEEMSPPIYLQEAFEAVNSAFVEKNNFINNARSIAEEKLPKARSNANTHLINAKEYYEKTIAKAEGEAGQFLKMNEAYNANPAEVKAEMLDKTRKNVFGRMKNLVLFPPVEDNNGPLKLIINGNGVGGDVSLPDDSYLYQGVE